MTDQTERAIARQASSGATSKIIQSPADFIAERDRWLAEHCHVMTPFAEFTALPPHYGIMPTRVRINPDVDAGEVYCDRTFCNADERAISKNGLAKFAQAGGFKIKTERTDGRQVLNLWEVKATITFVGIDGREQSIEQTEELDLRDGADRIAGFTPKQVKAARSKGLRHCESRAVNAAIRAIGIRQKYKVAELSKPFVLLRVVYLPDMTDPEVRKMVTAQAIGGAANMFGGAGLGALAAPAEPELLDVIDGTVQQPAAPSVAIKACTFDIEGSAYEVVLETGEILTTTDHEIGKQAKRLAGTGARVRCRLNDDETLAALEVLGNDQPSAARRETDPRGDTAAESIRPTVLEVKVLSQGTANGRAWRKYQISLSNREQWVTFEDDHAAEAEEAKRLGWPVAITRATPTDAKYANRLDVQSIKAVDPRQGELLGGES